MLFRSLLIPVFGMASSALFFGESFPPWKFMVFALVMGGIALASWPGRSAVITAGAAGAEKAEKAKKAGL